MKVDQIKQNFPIFKLQLSLENNVNGIDISFFNNNVDYNTLSEYENSNYWCGRIYRIPPYRKIVEKWP